MKTKLLRMLTIMLGVFLFAGVAAASDADVLQPASATTNLDSLRVGVAGQGGVTFFNGTVINEGDNPFTVGDNMRVDREIWRIQKGGDPLKISDNVIPTLTNANDFGTAANRWKSVYAKNINLSGDLMPASDASSNIGSPDKRWEKGYFSEEVKVGNSIIINDSKIRLKLIF